MEAKDYIYILFNNVFFSLLCLFVGVLRLRYIWRKGIKVPKNRIIQPDLDAFLVAVLLILFGIVSIIIKFIK